MTFLSFLFQSYRSPAFSMDASIVAKKVYHTIGVKFMESERPARPLTVLFSFPILYIDSTILKGIPAVMQCRREKKHDG